METNYTPRGFAKLKVQMNRFAKLKVQMNLVICTKFHVNRINCVESRRGGGRPIPPPFPLKASCNYFLFEASRVKQADSTSIYSCHFRNAA